MSCVERGSSEEGEMGMLRVGELSVSEMVAARWIARLIASKRTAFWALDCWMFFGAMPAVMEGRVVAAAAEEVDWVCIIALRIW